MFGIALTQLYVLALVIIELHEVYMDPSQSCHGLSRWHSFLLCTHFYVIHKLVEGAFNPTVRVTDKNDK